MLCYYSPLLVSGSIHSVDNIRLQLEFLSTNSMERFLRRVDGMEAQYYKSLKDFSYRHLFVFPGEYSTFSLGVALNGLKSSDRLYGFLDFNPNKILGDIWYGDGFVNAYHSPFREINREKVDTFSAVINYLLDAGVSITMKRFDYAIDVQVPRGKVQLCKEDQRKYTQFWRSPENYTEYLGTKNEGGRVKIYPKNIESELDYPLTRIEVTCDSYDYDRFCKRFPKVYIRRLIDLHSEGVMVQLLSFVPASDLDFYMRQLSAPSRRKYKALLFQEPFTVDRTSFSRICDVVKSFEY